MTNEHDVEIARMSAALQVLMWTSPTGAILTGDVRDKAAEFLKRQFAGNDAVNLKHPLVRLRCQSLHTVANRQLQCEQPLNHEDEHSCDGFFWQSINQDVGRVKMCNKVRPSRTNKLTDAIRCHLIERHEGPCDFDDVLSQEQ